ncbi:MAG: hypothetical protein GWP06_05140 [Actinobacteria bacterium]|nr:hypothetical protein [Actinomycetota bacterium]
MLGFTRQEQKFILFLLASFIVGLGINLFKKSGYQKGEENWSAEHDSIFTRFERISGASGNENSYSNYPKVHKIKQPNFQPDKKSIVGKVNINTADIEMLQSLPGIGPSMAQRIIDYRRSFGPFQSTGDLINIKGIGPKTFDKLKKAVTVNSKGDSENLHSKN